MNFVDITKARVLDLASDFIAIDDPHVQAGMLEKWDRSNYLFDLPNKWTLSKMVTEDGQLLGYRVVSGVGKLPDFCHSHRTSIRSGYQKLGLGRKLLNLAIIDARKLGYAGMTGLCDPENHTSKKFLSATGWDFLSCIKGGNELWSLDFRVVREDRI